MIRRLTVVVATALAAAFLATGAASAEPAASADNPHQLTQKEKAGLRVADEVLGSLFGGR